MNKVLQWMVGKTVTSIDADDREIKFVMEDGSEVGMYHDQECGEDVRIEDICGDLDTLIGVPLLMAEDISSEIEEPEFLGGWCEQWTFYKFATIKGYVTIRWYGESNGYYSTDVSIYHWKRR